VGLAFASGAAAATFPVSTSLVVEPAQPTTADSIRVRERTVYPQMCWKDIATTCGDPAADTLAITTQVQYCNGLAHCTCPAVFDPHNRTCTLAPLPAGTYTVVFRDEHVNPDDSMASFALVAHFTVDNATAGAPGSWCAEDPLR
jgi:hypothetical protein